MGSVEIVNILEHYARRDICIFYIPPPPAGGGGEKI